MFGVQKRGVALRNHLADRDSGIRVVTIPKNASTVIIRSLLARAIESGLLPLLSRHDWGENPHRYKHLLEVSPHDLLRGGSFLAPFREPAERMVSAFLDKFVRPKDVPDWASKNLSLGGYRGDPRELSFRAFVNAVGRIPVGARNEHWRPQSQFLMTRVQYEVVDFRNLQIHPVLSELVSDFSDRAPGYETDRAHAGGRYHLAGAESIPAHELRRLFLLNSAPPDYLSFLGDHLSARIERIYRSDYRILSRAPWGIGLSR